MIPTTRRPSRPPAVIVDIDGTLAIITDRSPYSHTGMLNDLPNAPVIAVVRALADAGSDTRVERFQPASRPLRNAE